MRKTDELADPTSCLNKARDDEWIFVFLERDAAAPAGVRAWVAERIRLGLNGWDDPKMVEALNWAARVEGMHLRSKLEAMKAADLAQAREDQTDCRREHFLRLALAEADRCQEPTMRLLSPRPSPLAERLQAQEAQYEGEAYARFRERHPLRLCPPKGNEAATPPSPPAGPSRPGGDASRPA